MMIHAKNYETVSRFVKVVQKKLWPLFSDTVCIMCIISVLVVICYRYCKTVNRVLQQLRFFHSYSFIKHVDRPQHNRLCYNMFNKSSKN